MMLSRPVAESLRRRAAGLLSPAVLIALCTGFAFPGAAPASQDTLKVVVKNVVLSKTPQYLGATEAAGFYLEDVVDLGINTYRLWTDMAELEWWDDDDAVDGKWDDSEYGKPTIAQIKANPNVIPWAWWDERFDFEYWWRYGVKSRRAILDALKANGIEPTVTLRTYNTGLLPERRPPVLPPNAQWAPRPPVDDAFRNEWWQHCFALAYWLNVRNDYRITRFQILNEPDYYKCKSTGGCSGQGWIDHGGTEAGYVQLVKDAYDAVRYANDMVGLPTIIHAPVVSSHNTTYVESSLDGADAQIQVIDYHSFGLTPSGGVSAMERKRAEHNPDGVLEPLWVSEWGALGYLGVEYKTLSRAILTGDQLMTFAERKILGLQINNMFDWNLDPLFDRGLVDMQDNGAGGVRRVRTETYYAYRLLIRGLNRAKDRLQTTLTGVKSGARAMVTRDDGGLYVLVKHGRGTVTVDLSAVGGYGGTATIYEYSARRKDEVVASRPVSAGKFSFSAPDSSLVLARVPPLSTSSCGGKTATLVGTEGDDLLTGTEGVDVIQGLGGNDALEGLSGNDVICGGPGADVIYGGIGSDKLFGDAGDDTIEGGAGADTIEGGLDNDTLRGDGGNDTLRGGAGDDGMNGGAGTDDVCDGGPHVGGDTATACESVLGVP